LAGILTYSLLKLNILSKHKINLGSVLGNRMGHFKYRLVKPLAFSVLKVEAVEERRSKVGRHMIEHRLGLHGINTTNQTMHSDLILKRRRTWFEPNNYA
jgi:hypothetical protein